MVCGVGTMTAGVRKRLRERHEPLARRRRGQHPQHISLVRATPRGVPKPGS